MLSEASSATRSDLSLTPLLPWNDLLFTPPLPLFTHVCGLCSHLSACRKFHGKVLAPVISLVVGFATQEAALMIDEDRPGDKEGRYKMESYTVRAGQSSACYEKSLINEVGELARFYTRASTTTELARMSRTLLGLFVALTAVHPGSGCRRNDAASLTLEFKVVEEVFEEEFGLICDKIIVEDTYEGVLKEDGVVLPFGLP